MTEPVSVELAKGRLGITSTHRDGEIAGLISAAREHVEDLSGHYLVDREVREAISDPFVALVILSSKPVTDVLAIDYVDSDGLAQSIADARVRRFGRGWALQPAVDGAWPGDASEIVAVLQCGYAGTAEDPYPPKLIQAILVLVAHWFDDPQGLKPIPDVVSDLCYQARSWIV